MRVDLPILSDYDVSPKTGFLPDKLPIERLSDSYYEPWEHIVHNLPAFNMTRQVQNYVDSMPLLNTDRLTTESEWQRASLVLGFLVHSYVWSGEVPKDRVPAQLSDPFVKVSDHLGLPAVNTYANMCLWNFSTLYPQKEWTLDNLRTNITFTGCLDESWFFLVSTVIEKEGASLITLGLEAIAAVRQDDGDSVTHLLQKMAQELDSLRSTLARMGEMCDPHIFYFRFRPFLAGWKNMAEAGLPQGVKYGNENTYRQLAGGSNAQSSLIPVIDILLGVEHFPTGEQKAPASSNTVRTPGRNSYIHEMRWYMPRKHREFLEHLQQVAEIRPFVVQNGEKFEGLTLAYDACVAMLRAFRDKHIQIVSRYIVMQAGSSNEASKNRVSDLTKRQGLAASRQGKTGTGGSALMPFLKQARDETGDAAAGRWGQRLLSESRKPMAYSYQSFKQQNSSDEKQHSGTWKA